ncbi:MAG: hypothetical protein ABIO29_03235 [Sphingomicrobium sp.]
MLAINQAASAFAADADDSAVQHGLDGRQFSVRLPFACGGAIASAVGAPLHMTLRPDGKALEVRAEPTIKAEDVAFATAPKTGASPQAPSAATEDNRNAVRSVEGFWIEWPWLMAEQCPAFARLPPNDPFMTMRAADDDGHLPAAPAGPERTAGLAQFFSDSDSRLTSRSGRDYRRVVPLADGIAPPEGLFLLIEGRLRPWPGAKVIRCRANAPGTRPSCIAGARIDRVAIERADDRAVLGEWTSS